MLDYDDLNALLIKARADTRAAECHGFLCGQICVAGESMTDAWYDYLLAEINDDYQLRACHSALCELAPTIETQINSPDLDFQLLLPDDEQSLVVRSAALAEWCTGFLSGLGIAGIGQNGEMSKDCNEMIGDIAKISRVKSDNTEGEESETAFFELVEYVRVGIMMIYQELCKNITLPDDDNPEVLH